MGRVIQGQIIASTALDSHGDQLTEEQIRRFFEQLPPQSLAHDGHDVSKPPVAKGFNKRLESLANGDLAIRLDIEVLDEEAFQRAGGFSIAYTGTTLRSGGAAPAIRILVNPQHFDVQAIAEQAANAASSGVCIDVTERVEKAAVAPIAIIVIVLVLTWDALREMWRGFWNHAGGDLFDYLNQIPRKDVPRGARSVRLEVPIVCDGQAVRVILSIAPSVTRTALALLDLGYVAGTAVSLCRGRSADKLIGRIEPGPRVIFDQIIDRSGGSHPL